MYGKLQERKLREVDYHLSCEEARKELDEYIDVENKRVNVDSAKKLAVMQHMDYEGFRQMVLGANIFPTKSRELYDFSKGEQPNALTPNKSYEEKKALTLQSNVQKQVEGNSEKHCQNFRDFKKKFMKFYEKELNWEKAQECYSLIKEQNRSRLEKIFNLECEADILVKVVEVFNFISEYLKKQENKEALHNQTGFMVKWFEIVLSIQTMQDISINILTKRQRDRITTFLQECQLTLASQNSLKVEETLEK